MRKRIAGRKLNRSKSARKALFRSLVASLVAHGQIKTTLTKAKFMQGRLDKLVTLAKNGELHSVKRLVSLLGNDKETAHRLVTIVKSFTRTSGFTRIVRLPQRRGDASKIALISWVDEVVEEKKAKEVDVKKEKAKEKTAKKTKSVAKKVVKSNEKLKK